MGDISREGLNQLRGGLVSQKLYVTGWAGRPDARRTKKEETIRVTEVEFIDKGTDCAPLRACMHSVTTGGLELLASVTMLLCCAMQQYIL